MTAEICSMHKPAVIDRRGSSRNCTITPSSNSVDNVKRAVYSSHGLGGGTHIATRQLPIHYNLTNGRFRDHPMDIKIGTAPDNSGVWFPNDPKQTPWQRYLDEVV